MNPYEKANFDAQIAAEAEHEKEQASSATEGCSIVLPKITEEMVDDYYPYLIADRGEGLTWNQAAIDFACLLKENCNKRGKR